MGRVSLILVSDIHINETAPASRIDDYEEAVFDKLNQIKILAAKHKVSAIVQTGDLWHTPAPSRNSHRIVAKSIRVLSDFGCDFNLIPGNHDLTMGRIDKLEQQPLGVLIESRAVHNLDGNPVDYTDGDLTVRVGGVAYSRTIEEFKAIPKGTADFMVSVVHEFATPDGKEFFGTETWSYEELAKGESDYVLLGHDHSVIPIKVLEVEGRSVVFDQPGSLMRGSLTSDNLERDVFVTLLEVNKVNGEVSCNYTRIPLEIRPGSKVFNVQKHEDMKKNTSEFEEFCTRLSSESLSVKNASQIISENLDNMSIPPEVRERALYYLTKSGL